MLSEDQWKESLIWTGFIERIHSRVQQPCKFIGTKESELLWHTNMAVSLFCNTNTLKTNERC